MQLIASHYTLFPCNREGQPLQAAKLIVNASNSLGKQIPNEVTQNFHMRDFF
jgi:hypothetical protein